MLNIGISNNCARKSEITFVSNCALGCEQVGDSKHLLDKCIPLTK